MTTALLFQQLKDIENPFHTLDPHRDILILWLQTDRRFLRANVRISWIDGLIYPIFPLDVYQENYEGILKIWLVMFSWYSANHNDRHPTDWCCLQTFHLYGKLPSVTVPKMVRQHSRNPTLKRIANYEIKKRKVVGFWKAFRKPCQQAQLNRQRRNSLLCFINFWRENGVIKWGFIKGIRNRIVWKFKIIELNLLYALPCWLLFTETPYSAIKNWILEVLSRENAMDLFDVLLHGSPLVVN